jgi:hypothetical protein
MQAQQEAQSLSEIASSITLDLVFGMYTDDAIRDIFTYWYANKRIVGVTEREMQQAVDHWLKLWRDWPRHIPNKRRPTREALISAKTILRLIPEGKIDDDISGWGYLYLLRANSGKYKIGYTADLARRINELQIANAGKIKLIDYAIALGTRAIEQDIHKHFAHKRVRGEWFQLSKQDVEALRGWFTRGVPVPEVP